MGFQNAYENAFHGFGNLVVWPWKGFGNIFRGVCTNLGTHFFKIIHKFFTEPEYSLFSFGVES